MKLKALKTWLAGTATLLTIMATNVAHAQAAKSETAQTDADITVDSGSSSAPAKQVFLKNNSGSSSTGTSSSSSSSTSSTSAASQSNSTAPTKATATISASSDTTESAAQVSDRSSSSSQSSHQISMTAKSQSATDANKQKSTTMYSGVTTSQKGSTSGSNPKTSINTQASLFRMSRAEFATLAAKAEIAVKGIDADDATITSVDKATHYKASDVLSVYSTYLASYKWSVPADTRIKSGDTATLTLPSNVLATGGSTTVNKDGETVVTLSLSNGATTGTMTFGDYFTDHAYDAQGGTFDIYVNGTQNISGNNDAKINKVGWKDDASLDTDGIPSRMYWQVVANLGSEDWKNVTITDQLGLYQSHDSEITLETGSYINGAFSKAATLGTYAFETNKFTYADGVVSPVVQVTVKGNQLSVNLDHVTTAINMFYSVSLEKGHLYTNNADVTYTPTSGTNPDDGSGNPGSGSGSTGGTDPVVPENQQSNNSSGFGIKGTYDDQPYNLLIIKTDDTDQPVSGATYELLDENGTVLRFGLMTDEDGRIYAENLSAGTYLLRETSAPTGYQLDSLTHEILVSAGRATSSLITYHVTDMKIAKTAVKVVKVWRNVPNSETTPNVRVTLLRDGQTYQTMTLTSVNGYTGTFSDLDTTDVNGTAYVYTVQETAISGYVSHQTTSNETVTLTNTYQTGTLTIVKNDASTQQALAGATFTVKDVNGNVVRTLVTDQNGRGTATGLAQGNYTVQETAAPAGYLLDTTVQQVSLNTGNNYHAMLTFADVPQPVVPVTGTLTIVKIAAETKMPLAGATFTVMNVNGEIVRTLITGQDGRATATGLALGMYTVQETVAPVGYQLDTLPQTVTITATNEYSVKLAFTDTLEPETPTTPTTPTKPDQVVVPGSAVVQPLAPAGTNHAQPARQLPQTNERRWVWVQLLGLVMFTLTMAGFVRRYPNEG
ncbi:Cna B-type domain-containing protein [Lactiplantibacillus garii]|uniref:Cna B-type domain-containing protein n=1 Tax=Lactiplantibacillus garii TaxID=2306423 RepID=A0A426D674_9LACO|nr:SpaA isopeptide-forming pilin-related protein [Lactiplantibacillus garii]RRK10157.1 Cna B-type domain-containing protein [Lactiplantibacillus garii]